MTSGSRLRIWWWKTTGTKKKIPLMTDRKKNAVRVFYFIFWEESFQSSRWPFHIRLKTHIKGCCSLHSQMILNERLYGFSGGVATSQHFCNLQLPHKDVGNLWRTFPLIQYKKKLLQTPVRAKHCKNSKNAWPAPNRTAVRSSETTELFRGWNIGPLYFAY